LESWSLNLPEPSGPVQGCNGIDLPLYLGQQLLIMAKMQILILYPINLREKESGRKRVKNNSSGTMKVKLKLTLNPVMKAQRGSTVTILLFL
jgi:hypothetical protein